MKMPWLKRIRGARPTFLAVLVGVAAVVLAVRIGTLVANAGPAPARELAAIEPAAGDGEAQPGALEEAGGPPVANDSEQADGDESGQADGEGTPAAAGESVAGADEPAPAAAASLAMPRDPSLFTDAEIAVLQQLAKRRAALDEREKDILLREGLLKAVEQRVGEKIAELKKLREIVAALIAKHEAAEKGKIDALVKIYEKMKPKDAARIFDELDMSVLLSVVQGMKEAKVAPILAEMDATKAREVTAELAARRDDLPQLTSGSGS